MFASIKNLFSARKEIVPPLTFIQKKEKFRERFFSSAHHSWIEEEKGYKKAFTLLIDCFDQDTLDFFLNAKMVAFIRASGTLSCAITPPRNLHTIIVFPDLCKLLTSASLTSGLAILAHEIGHIVLRHSGSEIDQLKAQIEADAYAVRLGLGHELQDILLDYPQIEDCRVRVSYLTSELMHKKSMDS